MTNLHIFEHTREVRSGRDTLDMKGLVHPTRRTKRSRLDRSPTESYTAMKITRFQYHEIGGIFTKFS